MSREEREAEMMEKLEGERESFAKFLETRHSSLEGLEGEIGEEKLDLVLKGMTLMGLNLDTAIGHAKEGNLDGAGYFGAQAKLSEDSIYAEMMQAAGAVERVPESEMVTRSGRMSQFKITNLEGLPNPGSSFGNFAHVRDYCMQRFDGSMRACELHLSLKQGGSR